MSSNSLTLQWSIPGIGALRPHYDAVRIVSSATKEALKALLPITDLEKASHKFKVVRCRTRNPNLRSAIQITCTDDLLPLQILAKYEPVLGSYRVTRAEIAFVVRTRARARSGNYAGENTGENARKKLFALVGLLAKPRHYRRFLIGVHKPELNPKPGLMAEPTFYYEDRKSSIALKCYCRHLKRKDGEFGDPCLQLEWTLTGKAAIDRHLGGNKISHLLNADLNKFLKRNLQLEKVDHVALGKLIRGGRLGGQTPPVTAIAGAKAVSHAIRQKFEVPSYRSERAVYLMLRNFAYREEERFGDWEHALWACQNSPAQIRGYLNRLKKIESLRSGLSHLTTQQKKGLRKRGRPRQGRKRQRAISAYRINGCFKRIPLERV